MPITIVRARQEITLDSSDGEFMGTATFPILEIPAHCDTRPHTPDVTLKGLQTVHVGGPHPQELAERQGAEVVRTTTSYRGNDFERMLAKVGYGFSVAQVGIDAFEKVYVLPSILGAKDDVGCWVGGVNRDIRNPGHSLHEWHVDTIGNELHVRVRLFASHGAPEYWIVAGRLKVTTT